MRITVLTMLVLALCAALLVMLVLPRFGTRTPPIMGSAPMSPPEPPEIERVFQDGRYGFIRRSTGEVLIPPQFERASDFSEGVAAVQIEGKVGFIDSQGRVVIQPQFDDAGYFSDGYAVIREGSLYGYVDQKGVVVIKPQFDTAGPFINGRARVGTRGGGWRLIPADTDMPVNYHFIGKDGQPVPP